MPFSCKAEGVDNSIAAQPQPISEYLCRIPRFALAAREDAAHMSYPGMTSHCPHAGPAGLIERPIGNRHVWIYRDIGVSDEENRRHRI